MNRFKAKKKAKEDAAAAARPSIESESTFSLFRRGKKSQEQEEKKELDLATALPSSDDFRTSLLMSGLSARFSMLREQDDPNTKIGKASDDSVLYPKRQSRLADFGFINDAGLGDIAEVESIKAPPGPSNDSITSNDSGGVMTRSKPTEGNVLFGGRQKIYKIAVGAASSKNLADGMSGRALYDDDVAMSAFQRWRQTEKEKNQSSLDGDGNEEDDGDKATSDETGPTEDTSFNMRSESPPPQGYNMNRETSSTTSSAPSGGRDSTAATSIASQPATLSKDGHQQSIPAAAPVSSTSALERHVTRTRRLYEQSLTQDLQQQQNSVVSRVDTLSRRPGAARTPDLGSNTPSPTMQTFADRSVGERRTILSKASAPNLRSFSPTTTSSSISAMENGMRDSNKAESKGASLSTPPLSPPISDAGTGEQTVLPIQAQDHGKATAMGVFQKPAQPYDDSKYAERQLQLQQSREILTQRMRNNSNASFSDSRSRSAASTRRRDLDVKTNSISTKAETSVQGDPVGGTTSDDTLESPILNEHVNRGTLSPQVTVERPSDQDHPAFRDPAIPTPLSLPQKVGEDQSSGAGNSDLLTVHSGQTLLGDSPTLGPNGGLSGMVRQHMRSGSDVSSIFGGRDNRDSIVIPNNPWEARDLKEAREQNTESTSHAKSEHGVNHEENSRSSDRKASGNSLESPRSADGEDEFASQLANARRRVREKLTSFVETDNTLSSSPPLQADPVPPMPSRSNPLGILRGKGSRGSLIDRGREAAPKVNKMLGIGAAISTSPVKEDDDDQDRKAPLGVKEHLGQHEEQAELKEEENAHPGFRTFMQARRELQNRKELETMAMQSTKNNQSTSSPVSDRSDHDLARTPSREIQPTGPRPQRKMSVDSQGVPQPPPRSRGRIPRDRSGSDDSAGQSRSGSRPPPQSREASIPREEHMFNAPATRKPTLRSPGPPVTDTRRSPHLPNLKLNQHGPQSAAPGPYLDRTGSGTNLSSSLLNRTANETMSAGASPLSPRTGVFELPRAASQSTGNNGSAPPTPTYPPPRRPSNAPNPHMGMHSSTLNNSMKRAINKSEISEPTFLMSTSRVPTMSLPQSATETREARSRSLSRPRSGSNTVTDHGMPPPLPPVNPRRKRDGSKTRTIINNLMGRNSGETDDSALSLSIPHLPVSGQPSFSASPADDGKSAFSISDDEKPTPRKLRKASSDVKMDTHASVAPGSKRISPPQVAIGPPAGRAVITNNVRGSPANSMPGGMF